MYSNLLDGPDLPRGKSLGAFLNFEFHPLPFGDGAKALHLNFRLMKEHVRFPFIRRDKSKTFSVQKLLYCSSHYSPRFIEPSPNWPRNLLGVKLSTELTRAEVVMVRVALGNNLSPLKNECTVILQTRREILGRQYFFRLSGRRWKFDRQMRYDIAPAGA